MLSVPHTPLTHRLLDARRLALLKPGAILVNVARGDVVDEPALVEALRSGRLRGAALDVFEQEPLPAESPLWDLPNVFVSPHSASTVAAENGRIVELFCDNLRRYLDGRAAPERPRQGAPLLTALRTNEHQLVVLGIEASVSHPTQSGSYVVDDYGRPMMLPGMSGVVANVRVGDPVYRWAADHLEPGVSAGCADRGRHQALQFLACLGNTRARRERSRRRRGRHGGREARLRPRGLPARRRSTRSLRATGCSCARTDRG